MIKHRSHSAAFKRQVAQEFIAGETLHGLSKRHDISRQLIRIWVGKYEAGALDDDVQAADLLQEYELYIRGNKADYDKWAALGNVGWSCRLNVTRMLSLGRRSSAESNLLAPFCCSGFRACGRQQYTE